MTGIPTLPSSPPPVGLPPTMPSMPSMPGGTRQSLAPGIKAPLLPGKSKLTDRAGPVIMPAAGAPVGIALPINLPTAAIPAAARSFTRQEPPPEEFEKLVIPPTPTIPAGAPRVEVPKVGKDPIGTCIETAAPGSIISVQAGTYPESLVVKSDLYFVANGECIIKGDCVSDNVRGSSTELVIFEGFTFIQEESQAASTATIDTGVFVFKKCIFKSNHTAAIMVKNDAKCYLVDCQVESNDAQAVMVMQTATFIGDGTRFSAPKAHAVQVRGDTVAKFTRCSVTQCGRSGFVFSDRAKFMFEQGSITKPFDILACETFGLISGCTIDVPLKIGQTATPYIVGCTFNGVSLECKDACGVRLMKTKFMNTQNQPALMVHADATVAMNEGEFMKIRSGAASAVYDAGVLKMSDVKFSEFSGVGAFATGNSVDMTVERCLFANGAGCGVVCSEGRVTVNECLFDRLRGTGLLAHKAAQCDVSKCKFVSCQLSGMEVNESRSISVDHCVFENNSQAGVAGVTSSDMKITECDFIKNRMPGLDLRECEHVTVTNSMAVGNTGGGFAFRNGTRVEIVGGGIGNNQQFGVLGEQSTTVNISELKCLENDNVGCMAVNGCVMSMDRCELRGNVGAGAVCQGSGTQLTIREGSVSKNGMGVQAMDNCVLTVEQVAMDHNDVHIEATDSATVTVSRSKFEQSSSGVGISVASLSKVSIGYESEFVDESTSAVANCAECNISDTSITDCGICGIYWYGQARGEIKNNTIARNGPCGIQVMSGQADIFGNTIEGHGTFGIHVQPGATISESSNTMSQNSMGDIDYEK